MVKKLLYLNGLAILSVVLYHSASWGFISMFWWAHRYRNVGKTNFDQFGNFEYYGLRMVEQFIIFAIPAFIFVSGYFIAVATGRAHQTVGWHIIFNRIKFLAIPFLLWSVVYLLFSALLGERHGLLDSLIIIITGSAADPFYFIPLLIQLYLLAPFLVYLVRKRWKPVLVVAAGIQILILLVRYVSILGEQERWFNSLSGGIVFTSYVFWFVLGIVIGFKLVELKSTLIRYRYWFLGGIVLFYIAGLVEWEILLSLSGKQWIGPKETLIDQLYAFFVILAFCAFEKIQLPHQEQMTNIGTRSYAIYLMHTLLLISTAKLVYAFFPAMMEYQLLFQIVLVGMGLGIPILSTYLVGKSFLKPYYRYIFG